MISMTGCCTSPKIKRPNITLNRQMNYIWTSILVVRRRIEIEIGIGTEKEIGIEIDTNGIGIVMDPLGVTGR